MGSKSWTYQNDFHFHIYFKVLITEWVFPDLLKPRAAVRPVAAFGTYRRAVLGGLERAHQGVWTEKTGMCDVGEKAAGQKESCEHSPGQVSNGEHSLGKQCPYMDLQLSRWRADSLRPAWGTEAEQLVLSNFR